MKCNKCGGMMTPDYMLDLHDDTGTFGCNSWRCMICGEVTDAVILANRHTQINHLDQGQHPAKNGRKQRGIQRIIDLVNRTSA